MSSLKKIASNKVLQYVFSRYFVYFIQFVNSLLIAIYLGPFYLGVWGFINLVVQYFEQLNFGISQSFNALGAIYKEDKAYVSKLFGSTLLSMAIVSGAATLFFFLNDMFQLGIGEKYNFSKYAPTVAIVVVLNYFIPAFLSLLRIYGGILTIAIVQSFQPVCVFLTLHFWRGENLLNVLVWTFLVSFSASIILCLIKMPVKLKINFDFKMLGIIVKKALYLFLYSASFYFILLSTRGFISSYFSVEQFGFFTFAFSLGNAILLLFKSFVFLIFPKVVNRLAHSQSNEAMEMVNKARVDYVTLAHVVGHLAILCFPLFIFFFPKYFETILVFNLIVLSLIVYTHCFGYQELLIAKGKDKTLGFIAFISLIINIGVALFLIKVMRVSYEYVVISTMIAYVFFLFLLVYMSRRILKLESSIRIILSSVFPLRLFVPFGLSFFLSISGLSTWYYILPLVSFVVINKNYLLNLKATFSKILNNPNVVDI